MRITVPPQLSACSDRGSQTSSQVSHIYKRNYRYVKRRVSSLNVLFFLTVRKNEKTSNFKLSYQLKSIEFKADTQALQSVRDSKKSLQKHIVNVINIVILL